MVIDEEKVFELSNYKCKDKVVHSNHNSLITYLNFNFDPIKPERKEIFNFRDEDSRTKYRKSTSIKGIFTNIFKTNLSFENQVEKWMKQLKKTIRSCFKKIRITNNGRKKTCQTFRRRKNAIIQGDKEGENRANLELSNENAEANMKRITENVKLLKNNKNGNESIWNLKKTVFPSKNKTVPVAKRNLSNQLITNPKELKKVYAKHFQHRMRSRPILEQHKEYDEEVNKKFNAALKISKDVLMPDWKDVDLEKVLKSLKKSQSQDILEMINELFMTDTI